MAMGSSLLSGYNSGRRAVQQQQPATQQRPRSFMPVINTLGNVIRARREAPQRRGARVAFQRNQESATDAATADREDRDLAEQARQEEQYRHEQNRIEDQRRQSEKEELIAAEEARRQETHEGAQQRSQMEMERGTELAGREDKQYGRKEAYENAKMGLMMKDPEMIREALFSLMPEATGRDSDTVTYGETEGGARKVTARPTESLREIPEFMFHPDGYIGVTFPGDDKPTVFENQDDFFKNVLAPMNPDRWSEKPGTARDRVTSTKNTQEADYKNKKLQAEIHDKAHEAAMSQFEADGYYQNALYDEDKYQTAYDDYVRKATGTEPIKDDDDNGSGGKGGRTEPPGIYKGDEPPEGHPAARRGPRGGWWIQRKGKQYPILKGKEQSPAAPSNPPRGPGRQPMEKERDRTAETAEIQASGISMTPAQQERIDQVGVRTRRGGAKPKKEKGQVYKGTAPPPNYPDAQYDRDEGVWRYFDGKKQKWRKVMT